jgi:hypothetical protein
VALAGRDKVCGLFFIDKHPKYQKLLLSDAEKRLNYPDICPEIITGESYSDTKPDSRKGVDFLMEQRVRKTHRCLPPGIPSENQWLTSVRNVNDLEQV